MHKIISKYNHETSIVSTLFSFCAFLCKTFFDKLMHRGYSNVFVKYAFYFTSEVDNIYIS